jgi:hypothetical protein
MVLGIGGPHLATLTCLATVIVAFLAGIATDTALDRLKGLQFWGRRARTQ